MTRTNDPPLVASVSLIPDSDEKADLDAPSDESGKLVVGQVPNISISETIVVADQAERLSLEVQEGDVAIQQDTTESYIFTGGPNVEVNWQLVQFDAVGGIAGEDIAPRDIDGRNVTVNGLLNGADTSGATAGEALISDGQGGFGFSPTGSASITRNGNEIEYVALDSGNLPSPTASGEIALVTASNEYLEDIAKGFFKIENATLNQSVNTGQTSVAEIEFSTDGTKLYELEFGGPIHQSSLSTPFDVSTATFEKSIPGQGDGLRALDFNDSGTKFYQADRDDDLIFELDLSTPFDIATGTVNQSISTEELFTSSIEFSRDGTKLYECGKFNRLHESTLSTPFDIGTATKEIRIDANFNPPQGIAISNDGTRFYEISQGGNGLTQYLLSDPFKLDSATIDTTINTPTANPSSVAFDDLGTKLYQAGQGGDIDQFDIPLTNVWESI